MSIVSVMRRRDDDGDFPPRRVAGRSAAAWLSLLVSILTLCPAHGQTFSEALTQAYRTNPQLDAARATQRATDEEVARAHATMRPQVSGNAATGWTRTDTQPKESDQSKAGDFRPRSYGVTVSQPLFRGLRSIYQIRVAEAQVRAGRETLRATEQIVLLAAATAYLDVVRDQAVVQLNEHTVEALSRQLTSTKAQFEVSEVTRTDVAQAEARRALAVANLAAARATLAASRSAYQRTIGSPAIHLREPSLPQQLLPTSLERAREIARRENPLVVNALYLEQAARFTIDQIRGELLPQVALEGSLKRAHEPNLQTERLDEAAVSARMTIPFYSGGEVEARVRQAKQTHIARLQQIEQVRSEQVSAAEVAWARYDAAKQQAVAFAAQLRAATLALSGVREEYKVGQRTLLDVLNSEQEVLAARVGEVSARRDVTQQALVLLQAVGRFTAADMFLGGAIYDPEVHYLEVRRKWFGLNITHANGRKEIVETEGPTHRDRR